MARRKRTPEIESLAVFTDALREVLGLGPLYHWPRSDPSWKSWSGCEDDGNRRVAKKPVDSGG